MAGKIRSEGTAPYRGRAARFIPQKEKNLRMAHRPNAWETLRSVVQIYPPLPHNLS